MTKQKLIRVMVAGKWDPLHRGHIQHFKKAKALGDYLIVVTHSDKVITKVKGYCLMPLADRLAVLRELKCVDEVRIAEWDEDGTVTNTLMEIKPDIFAKGGEYNINNLPKNEIEVCNELGIEIVFGVGDKLTSSQDIVRRVVGMVSGRN